MTLKSPSSLITKALQLAALAHSGQVDKADQPYILHPIRVATSVVRMKQALGQDKTALYVIALLHDVVEDTPITLKTLKAKGFPQPVLAAVDLLTKREGEPKEAYYARIRKNPLARLVKLADIGDNLDPDRLNLLPIKKRNELKVKYSKALNYLRFP